MEILISNHTSKPIYEQIADQIKGLIMSGELPGRGRSPFYTGYGKVAAHQRSDRAKGI